MSWPVQADCDRPECGHSSDVHFLKIDPGVTQVSVTETARRFACQSCSCPAMIRPLSNYLALIGVTT